MSFLPFPVSISNLLFFSLEHIAVTLSSLLMFESPPAHAQQLLGSPSIVIPRTGHITSRLLVFAKMVAVISVSIKAGECQGVVLMFIEGEV
jgi:hypothetical protein